MLYRSHNFVLKLFYVLPPIAYTYPLGASDQNVVGGTYTKLCPTLLTNISGNLIKVAFEISVILHSPDI